LMIVHFRIPPAWDVSREMKANLRNLRNLRFAWLVALAG